MKIKVSSGNHTIEVTDKNPQNAVSGLYHTIGVMQDRARERRAELTVESEVRKLMERLSLSPRVTRN